MTEARPPRRRLRLSIATVLTLGLGGLMLAALAAVSLVTLGVSERNTTDLLRKFSEVTIGSINLQIDRHIRTVRDQAAFVAAQIAEGRVALSDRASLADLMAGSLAGVPQSRGMAVFSADGRALRVGRFDDGIQSMEGDWRDEPGIARFIDQVAAGEAASRRTLFWVEQFEETTIAVDAPIRGDAGFLGVVSSVVGLTELSGFLSELSEQYEGTAFILYGEQRVLAHPSLAAGMPGTSPEHPLPTLAEVGDPVLAGIWDPERETIGDLLAGTGLSGHLVEVAGEDMVFVYQRLEGVSAEPWLVGAHFRNEAVGAPIRRLIGSALLALAIVVVALALAVLLGRAIARPIGRLADSAAAVESLDLDRVPPRLGSFFREIDAADQSFHAMLGGLRQFETYVPKRLVERLMTLGEAASRGEARVVTVLFTDIVGFTALAERLRSEEVAAFLNHHFDLLGTEIEAEEGTIDKYIGDSVMAFWGAPLEQADHAARACRAARAIAAAVARDNRARQAAGEPPVHLRIGIHSGPAIVGNIGAAGRVNYTLVGDTVNTAQRLEALGHEVHGEEPVTILISGDTRALLPADAAVEPVGSVRLRGRSGETETFRLAVDPPRT